MLKSRHPPAEQSFYIFDIAEQKRTAKTHQHAADHAGHGQYDHVVADGGGLHQHRGHKDLPKVVENAAADEAVVRQIINVGHAFFKSKRGETLCISAILKILST